MTAILQAQHIAVRGVVQGVGFRPFIYRLAQENALAGWVRNTSWGVEIEIEGTPEALTRFAMDLRAETPPLAHIESVAIEETPVNGHPRFEILHSEPQAGVYQLVSPDMATCPDCLREILDPDDRRYRYPFTNCTNCGPRFTIIADVPYDRPQTTMRSFAMCPDCQREYDDPLDRRFHAQPNACPVCGPQVTLRDAEGRAIAADDPLQAAANLLHQGHILAVKGLGGYQLACDATNAEAVARLRQRKHRPHKPFAVMLPDLAAVEAHAVVGEAERQLLTSPAAPIVLLPWREDSSITPEVAAPHVAAPHVAVNSRYLGVMLPYTPLHHLLLRDVGGPLIMTSGNLSEEPIARDNDEAQRRLRGIADYFLTHNRDIYSRYDDSVWMVIAGGPQPVRRARGYAPFPVRLPFEGRPTLACGPELKNTFCLTRDNYAFLSQHIGDMENLETLQHYEETIQIYQRMFRIEPEIVAVDMHPDYMSTRYGVQRDGQVMRVQHHHAHLAACLADAEGASVEEPVIGVILDGTGYGLDGHIWGGEFLIGDGRGFQRAAHLEYLPLPGGEGAIRKPYRIAVAYLRALLGQDAPLPPTLRHLPEAEQQIIQRMVEQGVNTPQTSSAGRLFDAVSALIGVCQETSYEAQAAIELEMLATGDEIEGQPYPYAWELADPAQTWGEIETRLAHSHVLRLRPLLAALLDDLRAGVSAAHMARRFHLTVAEMIADGCERLRAETGIQQVALSGGCFQNRLLLALALPRLRARDFQVFTHRQVPCNDGGVALGQAVIAHFVGAHYRAIGAEPCV